MSGVARSVHPDGPEGVPSGALQQTVEGPPLVTTLTVFGVPVRLERAAGVFVPTQHGMFYAKAVTIQPGERVIDVGAGSGVLAVAAAVAGARAVATDVDARAVAATVRNAALNGVVVEAEAATFFGTFSGPFDVILANLPNEIVAPAHLTRLDPADARTFAGGDRGNEQILGLLAAAPRYMHATSRLYLGVHSLTDYHSTIRAALERFESRLLDFTALPAKGFVTDNLDFYRRLDDSGMVHIFQAPDGTWNTFGYVFELRLRPKPAD